MAGDRVGGSGAPRRAARDARSRTTLALRRWGPLALLGLITAEILTLVVVAGWIGAGWTALLVIATSLAGLLLLRREGVRAWRGFRQAASTGTPPGPGVTDGVVGLGGALLLAVPGLITALAGAVLLAPPIRGLARGRVQTRAERRMSSAEAGQVFGPRRVRAERAERAPDEEIVEGEIVDR